MQQVSCDLFLLVSLVAECVTMNRNKSISSGQIKFINLSKKHAVNKKSNIRKKHWSNDQRDKKDQFGS